MFEGVVKALKFFGVLAGSISLFLLTKKGFDIGVVAVLEDLLGYYESFVSFTFDWMQPYLEQMIKSIFINLGLHLELNPAWKHIVVSLLALFGSQFYRRVSEDLLNNNFEWIILIFNCTFVILAGAIVPTHGTAALGLIITITAFVFAHIIPHFQFHISRPIGIAVSDAGKAMMPLGGLMLWGLPGLMIAIWTTIVLTGLFLLKYSGMPTISGRIKMVVSEIYPGPIGALFFVALNAGLKQAGI